MISQTFSYERVYLEEWLPEEVTGIVLELLIDGRK